MKYIDKTTESGKVVKIKNYKKRAKINKFKRKMLLLFIIVLAVTLVLTYAPFMKITKINCAGNEKITSEDVISASKICIGNNIFRVNKNKAIDNIKTIPYIKDVSIKRKLPSTMNITVTENRVYSYINLDNMYIYIDDTGKILEESEIPPETSCPILSGIKVKTHKVNEIIELKDANKIKSYAALMKVLSNSDFADKVTLINIENLNDIRVTVSNSLEIIIGNTDNLDYKINFLASGAYDNIGDNRSGTLDVSYGSNAVYKEIQ